MTPSTIEWRNGEPYSTQFGDIYFSTDGGIAETQHVFIHHNQLQQRWAQLASTSTFTIAETGFGTGLNFLCAWQSWLKHAPLESRLHFVSTEKYPLNREELQQALQLWPELQNLSNQLLQVYQRLVPGWNRLTLAHGRITLTLLIGDTNTLLPQLEASVDAWFLDGFAPSKNPDMWQPELFSEMARLSHKGTTFATFTSAGIVKRGLMEAGFHVHKVAGHGRKREMLAGYLAGNKASQVAQQQHAIVIGGGIAGTASAHALAKRGWQVTLLERHGKLAQEASGNPAGVLYPRLTVGDTNLNRMALHGYLYTSRLLEVLGLDAHEYQACGLLQLAFNQREQERQTGILGQGLDREILHQLSAEAASDLAGVALEHGGLYLPAAGWVHPPAFCQALATHSNIQLKLSTEVRELRRFGNHWQLWNESGIVAEAPIVIIAGANETLRFPQSGHCLLEPVRGQISIAPMTSGSQQLKTVICTEAYISPARDGLHTLGASFSNGETALDIRDADHAENLGMVRRMSTDFSDLQAIDGRAALRCASADYLPLTGRLLDSGVLEANPPRHNADPGTLPWLGGLYVNTGHGSKGLTTAPLCAEIIASALNHEPAPADSKLLAALDPNRFLLRKMGLKRLLSTPYCKISA